MPGGGRKPRQEESPFTGLNGNGVIDPSQKGRRGGGGGPPGGGMGLTGSGLELPGQEAPAPTYNKYRPPPGFAQDEANAAGWTSLDQQLKSMDKNQLLDTLTVQGAYWHVLAKIIPILNREGFDGKLLEDITGIDSRTQNLWMMAGAVYDSLLMSGEVSEEEAKYFHDKEEGPKMLSEFRFASEEELRGPSARYIVAQRLSGAESIKLARAVKDFERRSPEEKQGFVYTPADCLALTYFRDAVEQTRDTDVAARALERAMSVPGLSDSAFARMERLAAGDDEDQAEPAVKRPPIEFVRYTEDEIGYRPIGVAGMYGEADVGDVQCVTTANVATEFGFFADNGAGHQWMVMPSWRAVAFCKRPYALYIPEMSDVQILADATRGSEDHKTQREGPAIILADKQVTQVSEDKWYILPGPGDVVEMVPGADACQRVHEVMGEVVIITRTPRRAAEGSEERVGFQL